MKSDAWLHALDPRLARQLGFLMEADRLKGIIRANRISDGTRRENTAEHSWHLSLFAMVLGEWAVGEVDRFRVVAMLILHDLVEIECGDTPLYDATLSASQDEREKQAADRIFGLLPPDQEAEFRSLWEEFEAAETIDARFAKALDRLQPVLLNHAVGGGTWTDYDVDVARCRAKTGRIQEGSAVLWQAAEAVYRDAVANGWLRPAPDANVEAAAEASR
ncbi:HD domain-containing protein [Indioceanicola profundi]|uniref:HD domain-containing protein n=1 Tax=Indioceanicola profundi TaxID=2220096 RepID=UPI001968E6F9|nr:HD domain-containing protein [Indioceanicola profundi]